MHALVQPEWYLDVQMYSIGVSLDHTRRFGISTSDASHVVICHGVAGTSLSQPEAGVYSISSSAITPAAAASAAFIVPSTLSVVQQSGGVTVMTWCQQLGTSANEVQFAQTSSGNVLYFIGNSSNLPQSSAPGSSISDSLTSGSAALTPLPIIWCSSVELTPGLNMSWSIVPVNGGRLDVQVVFGGPQTW